MKKAAFSIIGLVVFIVSVVVYLGRKAFDALEKIEFSDVEEDEEF